MRFKNQCYQTSEISSQTSIHFPLFFLKVPLFPVSLSFLSLCLSFCIISSKSPVLHLSVALFIVSLMHWMISQDGVCPGILSCWTIQLNMIMLSTLTLLNTQVNEQFTVKCRSIWSHLHVYKQYIFIWVLQASSEWYMLGKKSYQEIRIYRKLKRHQRNYNF